MSDNPYAGSVIEIATQFRRALERQDTIALNRLITSYRGIYDRLVKDIDALTLEIAQNEITTPTQLYRMDRYKRLMVQTADELQKFQALTAAEVDAAGRLGVSLGEKQARSMIAAALSGSGDTRIAAVFHRLPTEAITQLLGFLDPEGPLYKRLGMMSKVTTEEISKTLVEAVAKGFNPRKTASLLQRDYGMALTDSLRMTRTAQLYSYRESSRASYLANADVVSGWQWHAQLDGLTCMSCVSMHGSIHPLNEPLNDHYNGRCAMLPITKEFGAHIGEKAGQEWFEGLSEAQQRKMMGAGKFEAWKEGKFTLDQLSVNNKDRVYGLMRSEAALKSLLTRNILPQGNIPITLSEAQDIMNDLSNRFNMPSVKVVYGAGGEDTSFAVAKYRLGRIEINKDLINHPSSYPNDGSVAPLSPIETIYHEYGHVIHGELQDPQYWKYELTAPSVLREHGITWKESLGYRLENQIKNEWGGKLSDYATKNGDEYIAESLVYYLRGDRSVIHPDILSLFQSLDTR